MTALADPLAPVPAAPAAAARPVNRARRRAQILHHVVLIFGVLLMCGPMAVTFMSSTWDPVVIHSEGLQLGYGGKFLETYETVLLKGGGFTGEITGTLMLWNSVLLGLGFAIGKIVISMLAAYAIVYFRFPFASLSFWVIFATLLLPLEVRILPSYEVVQRLGMLNSWSGLILPLIASATATFFFRQFFRSIPDELLEAARIDGAGPFRFFVDILAPLSKTMMAAIFIIMFVVGWNQYLWPALMTTDESMFTIVRGIRQILQVWIGANIPDYNQALALAILAMAPPALVVLVFQRMFIKGLVETEK
ncbi:MAG: sn-glycerol-3-phosphate ABC transporter permease UgpE [Rhodobacteraceae bacterium]|nr:sn-glycerol-3-phosphate ABC transporter permease UgpE [Paracoccaceae bacterium]MBR29359.1 sn-glycerol-3-phosphate ABC transporter permease UgpE [Paracoccaceae bacterium]|tara:strand:+ start:300 stop:1217 length:918 start_codon:yes stop_codon:yes gene_type:complete